MVLFACGFSSETCSCVSYVVWSGVVGWKASARAFSSRAPVQLFGSARVTRGKSSRNRTTELVQFTRGALQEDIGFEVGCERIGEAGEKLWREKPGLVPTVKITRKGMSVNKTNGNITMDKQANDVGLERAWG